MSRKGELVERMAESGAVDAVPAQPNVFDLIKRNETQFSMALQDDGGARRLARILLTEIRRKPKLGDCTPVSLMGAAMQCAQHDLEPGPLGLCYLVPIWNRQIKQNEVEWWLGYKGMIELARRSDRVTAISADDVRERDVFRVIKGSLPEFVHEPHYRNRGAVELYYAYAELRDGFQPPIVLTPEEVNSFRDRSEAYNFAESGPKGRGGGKQDSPWHTDYRAMALKTCVRRLFTWLPVSVEVRDAIAGDEQVLWWDPDDEHDAGESPQPRPPELEDPFAGLDGGPPDPDQAPSEGDQPDGEIAAQADELRALCKRHKITLGDLLEQAEVGTVDDLVRAGLFDKAKTWITEQANQ